MLERRVAVWAKVSAGLVCTCGLILLTNPYSPSELSRAAVSSTSRYWQRASRQTGTQLGVSHTYVLTASQARLNEATTMLNYAGIDFTPIWGPDVWSQAFNETYRSVFPDKGDLAEIVHWKKRDAEEVEKAEDAQARLAGDGNPVESLAAVSSREQHSKLFKRKYTLRYRYALACLLGHRAVWEDALRNNYDRVLVLEDDVDLSFSIGPVMDEVWQQIPDDWDLITLGFARDRHWWDDKEPQKRQVVGRMAKTWGTLAYIVRASTLPKILQATAENLQDPVDLTITWKMPEALKIKLYGVWPLQAQQLPVQSIIQNQPTDAVAEFGYNGLAFASGAWKSVTP